jgi:hypothetical protein
VERYELVASKGKFGVRFPAFVTKLNFIYIRRENFNDGAHFAALELAAR